MFRFFSNFAPRFSATLNRNMKIKIPEYQWLNHNGKFVAIAVILLLGFLLQFPYLREFPLFVHAWAQADWYSLAIGYVDNGMDFFHPQTMLYNKQDLGLWGSTITSVDFPIHVYCVAFLMKIFGNTAPWVFRCWTLLWSMIGVYFLYKLTFLLTKDWLKSLLPVMLVLTAPTYAYYACGFIPSIPSLTFAMIGLWGYLSYTEKDNVKYFYVGFACLTLSAMIRSSQVVLLIAVCSFEFLRLLKGKSHLRTIVAPVLICFSIYVAYYLWNKHLSNTYGSMFLGKLMLASDKSDLGYVLQNVEERWKFHYFQRLHHWIVVAAVLAGSVCAIIRQWKKSNSESACGKECKPLSYWYLWIIWLIGEILFVAAMVMQFSDHDYYFLDSLFLPIIMLLVLSLRQVKPISDYRKALIFAPLLVVLCVLMTVKAVEFQQLRRSDMNDPAVRSYNNFFKSDQLLDAAGISRDAKMLALFAYPKSSAFIEMHRRGYIVLDTKEAKVRKALIADYDYIVIENQIFREEFENHGYVLKYLKPVTRNEGITVCTLSDTLVSPTVESFFEQSVPQ